MGETENISNFGICTPTAGGKPPVVEVAALVKTKENSADGTTGTVVGRMCTPEIIGTWQNVYKGTRIVDNGDKNPGDRAKVKAVKETPVGESTITTDSFLICRYGGIIEPRNSGQELEAPMATITANKVPLVGAANTITGARNNTTSSSNPKSSVMVTYLYAEFYSNNNSYCDFKASVSEDLKRYANIDTNEVYTSLDIGSLGYQYSNSKITSSAGANNTTVKTITFKYIRTRFTIVLYVNGGREGSYTGYMDEDDRVRYVIEPKRLFLGLGYDCINDASKNPKEKVYKIRPADTTDSSLILEIGKTKEYDGSIPL